MTSESDLSCQLLILIYYIVVFCLGEFGKKENNVEDEREEEIDMQCMDDFNYAEFFYEVCIY